jgi:hypothetical protein
MLWWTIRYDTLQCMHPINVSTNINLCCLQVSSARHHTTDPWLSGIDALRSYANDGVFPPIDIMSWILRQVVLENSYPPANDSGITGMLDLIQSVRWVSTQFFMSSEVTPPVA